MEKIQKNQENITSLWQAPAKVVKIDTGVSNRNNGGYRPNLTPVELEKFLKMVDEKIRLSDGKELPYIEVLPPKGSRAVRYQVLLPTKYDAKGNAIEFLPNSIAFEKKRENDPLFSFRVSHYTEVRQFDTPVEFRGFRVLGMVRFSYRAVSYYTSADLSDFFTRAVARVRHNI